MYTFPCACTYGTAIFTLSHLNKHVLCSMGIVQKDVNTNTVQLLTTVPIGLHLKRKKKVGAEILIQNTSSH